MGKHSIYVSCIWFLDYCIICSCCLYWPHWAGEERIRLGYTGLSQRIQDVRTLPSFLPTSSRLANASRRCWDSSSQSSRSSKKKKPKHSKINQQKPRISFTSQMLTNPCLSTQVHQIIKYSILSRTLSNP